MEETGANEKKLCINCGHEQPTILAYCGVCGQKNNGGTRLTVLGLLQSLTMILLNVENGFWRTLKDLFLCPHRVFRDYLAGNRIRYYDPWKYFLLLAGIGAIVYLNFGDLDGFVKGMQQSNRNIPAAEIAILKQWMVVMKKYLNLIYAVQIPFMALASLWVFTKQGLNFAEHLVVNVYILAQFSAIGAIANLAFYGFGANINMSQSAGLFLTWAYSIYACGRFFSPGFTFRYFVRALLWQFLGTLFFMIATGIFGFLFFWLG